MIDFVARIGTCIIIFLDGARRSALRSRKDAMIRGEHCPPVRMMCYPPYRRPSVATPRDTAYGGFQVERVPVGAMSSSPEIERIGDADAKVWRPCGPASLHIRAAAGSGRRVLRIARPRSGYRRTPIRQICAISRRRDTIIGVRISASSPMGDPVTIARRRRDATCGR